MEPSEAKTAIRTVVDRTTAAVGGNWTVRSGPALSMCPGSADDRGVAYKLILDRDGADALVAQQEGEQRDRLRHSRDDLHLLGPRPDAAGAAHPGAHGLAQGRGAPRVGVPELAVRRSAQHGPLGPQPRRTRERSQVGDAR